MSHSVEISAAPADVWHALVDPDWTRRWYHGLVVAGDWRPGGEVSYRFPDGTVAEAGTVVDIQEGRRLALETRFLWDSGVREEPAHRTTWELEPAGAGSAHVSVTFEVSDEASATSHMLRDEGGYLPRSLRLTLDLAEQARLARREVIGAIEIRDLTPDMLGDYNLFFDEVGFQDHPEWQSCYCSETNLAPDATRTVTGNRAGMSELIQARSVTALIAFADGQPVGWCNYGETTKLAGLMAKLGLQATDHEKVGSVACFVVPPSRPGADPAQLGLHAPQGAGLHAGGGLPAEGIRFHVFQLPGSARPVPRGRLRALSGARQDGDRP